MSYQYFDGFPIAGSTPEFLVTFASETDLDALARAQAIVESCESDLDQLQVWFNTDFRAGSPHGIWVHVDSIGGGASNNGYTSDQSPRIFVLDTAQPAIRDEYARFLFVAELAEILMDFTGYGWNRGFSSGEGLSIVMATELHGPGYYGSNQGPRIQNWLNANPRPDWVSATEQTDRDFVSFGCAVLFIYYLRYQLGFDYTRIITAGGATLADTYVKFYPGNPGNAFGGFATTVSAHLPVGTPANPPRDNIFPLVEAGTRIVSIYAVDVFSSAAGAPSGKFPIVVKPGPLCPAKEYTYETQRFDVVSVYRATAGGFANASFTWRVGGTVLSAHGQTATASVPVTLTDTVPFEAESVSASLTISYTIVDGWNTSRLTFNNVDYPGNVIIDVFVDAVEALIPHDPVTTGSSEAILTIFEYLFDPPWDQDVQKCNFRHILQIRKDIADLSEQLTILRNRPDPPPDQLKRLARVLRQYEANLEALTHGRAGVTRTILTSISSVASSSEDAAPGTAVRLIRPSGATFVTYPTAAPGDGSPGAPRVLSKPSTVPK
ncbi:MAG TPA: hypothetical protein VGJ20_04545 [Xanthobacteraceae bacterium]